jgi:hypothetical protein
MSDKFFRPPQVPDLGAGQSPENAEAGFLRVFGRENRLIGKLPNGAEVNLTAPSIFGNGTPVIFSASGINIKSGLKLDTVADLAELSADPQVELYNTSGLIAQDQKIKCFFALVTSDGSGDFTVDWSAAGFTQPPFAVHVTALGSSTDTVQDRVWATMRNNISSTQGQGYTLRGNQLIFILGGGGPTTRTAPNTVVSVIAYGV